MRRAGGGGAGGARAAGRGGAAAGRAARAPHDWLSADWRWGYGVGAAHDAAAELRARLCTPEARAAWLADPAPWDEALLALALKIQRAGNRRRIDRGVGFGAVLDELAAGAYGSGAAPDPGLVSALEEANAGAAPPAGRDGVLLSGGAAARGDRARDALLGSLLALGFVDDGL